MKHNQQGQSLIEVLAVLSIAVTIVSAMSISVITSLSTAQFSKNKTLTTQYAQQGMETMRHFKVSNYAEFNNLSGSYCMDKNCGFDSADINNCLLRKRAHGCGLNIDAYSREVIIEKASLYCVPPSTTPVTGTTSSTPTKITLNVYWNDGKCPGGALCEKTQFITCVGDNSFTPVAPDTITVITATPTPALDAGLVGYWKFDETSGAIATDSSVNGNDGILTGPLIGNFENTLDGFLLDCGGQTTFSYVTGKIGKGIKIWSTGGDGFACGFKAISSIPNGYSVYFYGKGYVKSVFYGPTDAVGSTSYLEDVQTGCKTPYGKTEIFAYCNNRLPYRDWKLFKLTAFRDGGASMGIYAKWPGTTEDVVPQQYNLSLGLGEEYAGYYDYITTVGPSWNTGGTSNGALSFNGTDNFVRINNSSALTSSLNITSSFTISLWVKPAANQNNGAPVLVSRHLGVTPGAQYQLGLSSSGTTHKIRFCSESNNPESSFGCQVGNGILTNDRWNHLAVTFNAGAGKLNYYLNGALDKQFNLTGLPNYQANVTIGAATVGSGWGWYFKGLLDEVKIYNYARTETQIAQDANATTTIP